MGNLVSGGVTLFPSHILFIDFGEYYAFEHNGAKRKPQKLKQKAAKFGSVYEYWDPFHGNQHKAMFSIGGGGQMNPQDLISFSNLSLAHRCDAEV